MFHFGYADGEGFAGHEFAYGFLGGYHYVLELLDFVIGECQAGKGDEHVTGAALEPGVACQYVVFMFTVYEELVCAVDKCVIEIVSRSAHI